MPVMPQNEAGWRIEPPVSVPVAAGTSRAATAVPAIHTEATRHEGRRAPGKGGARMALEMRNGQTVSLVMAPAGKQTSPKIMLITAEVQNPAPAPAAARRQTRTR